MAPATRRRPASDARRDTSHVGDSSDLAPTAWVRLTGTILRCAIDRVQLRDGGVHGSSTTRSSSAPTGSRVLVRRSLGVSTFGLNAGRAAAGGVDARARRDGPRPRGGLPRCSKARLTIVVDGRRPPPPSRLASRASRRSRSARCETTRSTLARVLIISAPVGSWLPSRSIGHRTRSGHGCRVDSRRCWSRLALVRAASGCTGESSTPAAASGEPLSATELGWVRRVQRLRRCDVIRRRVRLAAGAGARARSVASGSSEVGTTRPRTGWTPAWAAVGRGCCPLLSAGAVRMRPRQRTSSRTARRPRASALRHRQPGAAPAGRERDG